MYYLKYNNIDLTQLVKVRDVSLPSLPTIEHSSINMWDMDGNIFNSLSYGNKEIEISAIIQPLNPNDLELYVNDIKRAFYVREPRPLYLGDETKYLLAVTEGDVTITELGTGTCELNVSLVAYYPYWIAKEVKNVNITGSQGVITNKGDVPTTPIISVGIGGDATFVQVEKRSTKERILIGELPRTQKPTVKSEQVILFDECKTTSGWTSTAAALDPGCGIGGTLSVTSTGGGLCLGSVPSGNNNWNGAAYRKSLNTPIKDFKVDVNFTFNSAGVNGDPTIIKEIEYDDDLDYFEGKKETLYVISSRESVQSYNGPSSSYFVTGTHSPGEVLRGYPIEGFLRILGGVDGYAAYIPLQYVAVYIEDNRVSNAICNFVTNKTTALRSEPDEWSTALVTIPSGTVIRCYVDEVTREVGNVEKPEKVGTGFRELDVTHKGHFGYVKMSDMTRASEAGYTVTYEVKRETADDKEGIMQVYGYANNGTQLFSLSLIDNSAYHEATYPLIKANGKDLLCDVKYENLTPLTKEVQNNDTVKIENVLSGEVGSWNGFEGQLYIERVRDVWYAFVNKYGGKFISSAKVKDTTNSNLDLSYIVIYMGAPSADKMSCMSINEIKVKSATTVYPEEQNIQRFEVGDMLQIDCGVPCVKLNGVERNDLVDIGSRFFDLDVGQNDIKITSDSKVNFGVLFNEKYL